MCPTQEDNITDKPTQAREVMPERRINIKVVTTALVSIVILALVASTIVAALYVPQVAIYVPILTIGLALALQKFIASFIAYFVIIFSRIYEPGDRIRIGEMKGDVRRIGLVHTVLQEVGEDEKLGGEVTGRLLHVPNLIILDQSVLNYSKDYSIRNKVIFSEYMLDEVRVAITTDSNAQEASDLLENILKIEEESYMEHARRLFRRGHPQFLKEAIAGTRVLIYVEPQHIWIKGKFIAPLKRRNELKTKILLQFIKDVSARPDIKLA
ncbi:mechanosensitive ion channel family protein [Chloroflexota bacterium]